MLMWMDASEWYDMCDPLGQSKGCWIVQRAKHSKIRSLVPGQEMKHYKVRLSDIYAFDVDLSRPGIFVGLYKDHRSVGKTVMYHVVTYNRTVRYGNTGDLVALNKQEDALADAVNQLKARGYEVRVYVIAELCTMNFIDSCEGLCQFCGCLTV